MLNHERPSILAVGLPEIFDNAEAKLESSTDAMIANHIASSSRMAANDTPRIDNDAELLRWMIFSAAKRSARPAVALGGHLGGTELRVSDLSPSCDDSAFGLTLGEANAVSAAVTHRFDSAEVSAESPAESSADQAQDEVSFIYASSAKRAIELLRIMRFDLLVTSDQLPDMAISQLVGRVRAARPWQKWALVMSGEGTNAIQSEIAARSLGAAAIFDAPGDLGMISELAQAVAARQPAKLAVGGSTEESVSDSIAARPVINQKQVKAKTRRSTQANRIKA